VLMARDLVEVSTTDERIDNAEEKRVELHFHTAMSAMDGLCGFEKEGFSQFSKVCKRLKKWGHTALAITDHGVIQAFPEAYDVGKEHGIKMLLGMEAYIVDDGVSIVMLPEKRKLVDDEYVVFDVETTGLSVSHDVIIELAAVKIRDGNIVDRFETFVNPHRSLSAKTTELTGITDEMVREAPELHEILPNFLTFLEGSVLVAHNARFDMGFLQTALKQSTLPAVTNPVLDTLELARFLFPDIKNHRLNTLAKKLDVHLEQHHRAIYDAEATGFVLLKMVEELIKREIVDLIQLNEVSKDRNLNRLRPFHTILFAQNKVGLKHLYKLVSMSHIDHFYRVPRIPKSTLEQYRTGLLIGSGCEKGELYETILNKTPEEAEEIAKFYDYLEIQPLEMNQHLIDRGLVQSVERLKLANKLVVEIGEKLGKPVVATGNTHYLDEKDAIYREVVASNQMGGVRQSGPLPRAHLRTTDEMLAEFAYLGEGKSYEVVVTNTRLIADQIEELNPFPEGTFTPEIEGVEEELRTICYKTAHEWYGNPLPQIVSERLDTELNGIINNGYAVIYMISSKLVTKSIDDGYLVGSRGSVGSSFVATMSRVSEVNPLPPHYRCQDCYEVEFVMNGSVETGFDLPDKVCSKCGQQMKKDGHDIPFATFLGFEGDKTPDIDLNFASDYQARCHTYTEELLGKECIFRAGSVGTIKEKTAFGYVKKYAEENNRTFRQAELARIASGCIGVKRTTGQHPGGLMVVPKNMDVEDFTPVQRPANNMKSTVTTTHFDYNAIGGKILKFDLLGHTAPEMLKMLKDMTGVDPTTLPTNDPKVIELFRSTKSLDIKPEDISGVSLGTLGIPEFGTAFAQGILEIANPSTIGEFTRVSGLSHGTDVWAGNARELIQKGVCTLSEAICNRDDIMLYLIRKGLPNKTSFKIMEAVRKGRGLTDEQATLMREHDVPEWYLESCRKIKYMFPRAHAVAYVISAIWIAYYKVYHPSAFYAAYFSKSVKDFDIELMVKGYKTITNAMKEIKEKGYQASAKEKNLLTVLELAQEMYARGITFHPIDLYQSHSEKFLVRDGQLLPPFSSIAGVGESAADGIVESRVEGEFLSIEDLQRRARVSSTVVESLQRMGCLKGLPESNQLSLFV
jgi:DNA polymerase-3 subunit alpha (Gram-positive type)